jgi:transposase-like protein
VQARQVWSFVGSKNRNTSAEKKLEGRGDAWTWTAIDADSKLIVSYLVATRGRSNCYDFMKDLASRPRAAPSCRVQLKTDRLYWYVDAVDHAFGIDVDFAMIRSTTARMLRPTLVMVTGL